MAYYVQPDYWFGGYAEGDPLEVAGQAVGASGTNLSAGLDQHTGNQVAAQSGADIGPTRITFSYIAPSAESGVDAGAYLTAGIYAKANGISTLPVAARVVFTTGSQSIANGIMDASMRLKWERQVEAVDNWSAISEASDSWTNINEPTDNWTNK